MGRKISVSNENCRLDVKIYGLWTKFEYMVAQPGDPKVKVKLTNLNNPRQSITCGNRFFPRNLVGAGETSISAKMLQYKLYNKNYKNIAYSSIQNVLTQAREQFQNKYSL